MYVGIKDNHEKITGKIKHLECNQWKWGMYRVRQKKVAP